MFLLSHHLLRLCQDLIWLTARETELNVSLRDSSSHRLSQFIFPFITSLPAFIVLSIKSLVTPMLANTLSLPLSNVGVPSCVVSKPHPFASPRSPVFLPAQPQCSSSNVASCSPSLCTLCACFPTSFLCRAALPAR